MDYPRPPGTSLVEHEAYQRPAETDQTSRGVAGGDRPPPEPMSEDEFNGAVRTLIDNARSLMSEWIEPQTERAWRYYQGSVDQNPMGLIGRDKDTDEQVFEGSAAVLTECHDQVQMLKRRGDRVPAERAGRREARRSGQRLHSLPVLGPEPRRADHQGWSARVVREILRFPGVARELLQGTRQSARGPGRTPGLDAGARPKHRDRGAAGSPDGGLGADHAA
jgi:hypothetical protein